MIRIELDDGRILEFADTDDPQVAIAAAQRFLENDHGSRLAALSEDPSFLGLPRIERQAKFNEVAQSGPLWQKMTPDDHRWLRERVVDRSGANEQERLSPAEDPYITAPDSFGSKTRDYGKKLREEGGFGPFSDILGRELQVLGEGISQFQRAPSAIAGQFAETAGNVFDAGSRVNRGYEHSKRALDLMAQDPNMDPNAAMAQTDQPDFSTQYSRTADELAESLYGASDTMQAGSTMMGPEQHVQDVRDIHGPQDFAEWLGATVGGQGPIMATTLGATALNPALGLATGIGMETGSISQEIRRDSGGEADPFASLAGGTIAGAMEYAPVAELLSRTPGVATGFRSWLKTKAKNALIQAAEEGSTEAVQTVIEQAAQDYASANRGDFENMRLTTPEGRTQTFWDAVNAAAAGAGVGGPAGFMGSVKVQPQEQNPGSQPGGGDMAGAPPPATDVSPVTEAPSSSVLTPAPAAPGEMRTEADPAKMAESRFLTAPSWLEDETVRASWAEDPQQARALAISLAPDTISPEEAARQLDIAAIKATESAATGQAPQFAPQVSEDAGIVSPEPVMPPPLVPQQTGQQQLPFEPSPAQEAVAPEIQAAPVEAPGETIAMPQPGPAVEQQQQQSRGQEAVPGSLVSPEMIQQQVAPQPAVGVHEAVANLGGLRPSPELRSNDLYGKQGVPVDLRAKRSGPQYNGGVTIEQAMDTMKQQGVIPETATKEQVLEALRGPRMERQSAANTEVISPEQAAASQQQGMEDTAVIPKEQVDAYEQGAPDVALELGSPDRKSNTRQRNQELFARAHAKAEAAAVEAEKKYGGFPSPNARQRFVSLQEQKHYQEMGGGGEYYEVGKTNKGDAPIDEIDVKQIQRIFPKAKVTGTKTRANVEIPGIGRLLVSMVEMVKPHPKALANWGITMEQYEQGVRAGKIKIKGAYGHSKVSGAHVIMLAKGIANQQTQWHEAFHFGFQNALSKQEKDRVLGVYEQAARDMLAKKGIKNPSEMALKKAAEEVAAVEYAKWATAREGTSLSAIWKKIQDFAMKLADALGLDVNYGAAGEFAALMSGKAYEANAKRAAEAGPQKQEQTSPEAKKTPEQLLKSMSKPVGEVYDLAHANENQKPGEHPGLVVTPENRGALWTRRMFDVFDPILRVQKQLTGAAGKIEEALDTYLAASNATARTGARIEDFMQKLVKPLVDKMVEHSIGWDAMHSFLEARHAFERNERGKKINPGGEDAGAGISDEKAQEALDKMREDGLVDWKGDDPLTRTYTGKLADAATKFDAITEQKLRWLEQYGLVDAGKLKAFRKYRYYAPLKGKEDLISQALGQDRSIKSDLDYTPGAFAAMTEALINKYGPQDVKPSNRPKIGVGFDVRNPEGKRALGRTTRATSPIIAQAVSDAMEVLVKGEKNRVGRTLLEFARKFKDAKNIAGQNLFEIDTTVYGKSYNSKKGVVEVRPNNFANNDPNVIAVREGGAEHFIRINDEALASAMKNLSAKQTGILLKIGRDINRKLAQLRTSWNPAFMIPNFVRDLGTAGIHLASTEEGRKLLPKVLKHVPGALVGIRAELRTEGGSKEWGKWWDEYRKSGGKVEFWQMPSIEQQAENLVKELRRAESGPRSSAMKVARGTFKLLEDYNSVIENAVRLSAYRAAREADVSKAQAAKLARGLTLDFNRHGEWASAMSGWWLFVNAGLQGTNLVWKVAKTPAGKKILGSTVAVGAAQAMVARLALGKDDDDDRWYWDKIPSHVKERNMIFPKFDGKGGYFKLPLPYGFNWPFALGVAMSDVGVSMAEDTFGKASGRSVGEGMVDMMSATAGAFNPLGEADLSSMAGWVQMISPASAKPFVDIAVNRNFWGGPIRKNAPSWNQNMPQSELYFSTVSEPAKWLTGTLNRLAGGSRDRSSWLDMNPENLDYLFQQYAGGAGDFITDSLSVASKLARGQKVAHREIPIWRSFVGEEMEYVTSEYYYDVLKELDITKRELNRVEEEHPRDLVDFRKARRDVLAMEPIAKRYEKMIKAAKERGDDAQVMSLQKRFIAEWNKRTGGW